MNSSPRFWADDSSEVTLPFCADVTRPGDVLALSGERIALDDDDVFPLEDFLDEGWDDEPRALRFSVSGAAPAVIRMRHVGGGLVTQAQGIVKRIEEDRLLLGTPGSTSHEIALGYRVPASLDLRPLIGRRVQVRLEEAASSDGRDGQVLTVRTLDGRVWLIARSGTTEDVAHALGSAEVRLSLSRSGDGPLVVGGPELQHIVSPGGEARMRIGAARYVVELVSRDASGWADYFIADDRLWH
jgi:hypothetical protein